jgi:hypothetical protein
MPNRPLVFSVNIVNNTDHFVAFGRYHPEINVGVYHIEPVGGVMPPRSTQRLVVKRVPEEEEHDDMQCEDKFFLWSSLASEGVQTVRNRQVVFPGGQRPQHIVTCTGVNMQETP